MLTNCEGLTWPEWAYAAAIPEPHCRWIGLGASIFNHETKEWERGPDYRVGHDRCGYAHLFVKERRAWRNGEDPSEYRGSHQRKGRD